LIWIDVKCRRAICVSLVKIAHFPRPARHLNHVDVGTGAAYVHELN
jgi:hypothetical protein